MTSQLDQIGRMGILGIGLFSAALLSACSSQSGGGGSVPQATAGQRMCKSLKDAVARCGAGACDQALIDDCEKIAGVLSDPYLIASAECMEQGGAATSCLASSLSALTPTPAQEEFVAKFCSDCPPVPIPGCEDALLGKGNVPEQLQSARQLLSPFGDAVLKDIETQCFGGLTCLAELSSCVQQVLVTRAVPSNTVQCLTSTLLTGGSEPDGAGCGTGGGAGTSSGGSAGVGGGSNGGSSGSGTGGVGGGSGGFGGSSASGGSSGSAASGGTGGSSGGSTSCLGYCGGQAPGGCWCDDACHASNDCCTDKLALCGGGGTGGSGGAVEVFRPDRS